MYFVGVPVHDQTTVLPDIDGVSVRETTVPTEVAAFAAAHVDHSAQHRSSPLVTLPKAVNVSPEPADASVMSVCAFSVTEVR